MTAAAAQLVSPLGARGVVPVSRFGLMTGCISTHPSQPAIKPCGTWGNETETVIGREQQARMFLSFLFFLTCRTGGAWKLETGIIRDQRALIDGWETNLFAGSGLLFCHLSSIYVLLWQRRSFFSPPPERITATDKGMDWDPWLGSLIACCVFNMYFFAFVSFLLKRHPSTGNQRGTELLPYIHTVRRREKNSQRDTYKQKSKGCWPAPSRFVTITSAASNVRASAYETLCHPK
ncbi:hypothetical protein B0J13DRAFT_324345 [Dactylonectria estremocensis]|uniref:Uncharacterized protein n=1 Tax=Dactylonectria estremocensis TaxID=1079267 RepID=A0A9P9EW61_9HYPO|nr:hypothetical protein B0J13DRAFT_324345 [Dactylonectria estremocensis]